MSRAANTNARALDLAKMLVITGGNKITLPKDVCARFKIKKGDYVFVELINDRIVLTPVSKSYLARTLAHRQQSPQ